MADRPHVALIVETSLISGREILRGISKYVREHGPWSIYHEPRSLEASLPTWLKTWNGDGIIARLQNEHVSKAIVDTGLPVVDVLGVAKQPRAPLVHVDNFAIGRLVAEHLLECGFSNFGYCGIRNLNWSKERQDVFTQTIEAAGYRCDDYQQPFHSRTDSSWEKQQERLARWIRRLPKPVGVMVCYDPYGQRVLEACRRAEALVPDEVAVIGVDNDETVCEVCDPPLSSIAANHVRVGFEAAGLLDRMMNGEPSPKQPTYIAPRGVVIRQSTDVLAIEDPDVAAAVRFIREHAADGIRASDVAERVSISYSALKGRFRNIIGRSIHDEIVRIRIDLVKELLVETEMPIQHIAVKAGFQHQEYMGVVFKAKVGQTPGKYRKVGVMSKTYKK